MPTKLPKLRSNTGAAGADKDCSCGTGRFYKGCCGRWHAGLSGAHPEALMRSRYSAFVLQNEPYLLSTWHPSTRPARIDFFLDQAWLSLTVIEVKSNAANSAEVEFVARSRVGQSHVIDHHERSQFLRESGTWLYVDGVLL